MLIKVIYGSMLTTGLILPRSSYSGRMRDDMKIICVLVYNGDLHYMM